MPYLAEFLTVVVIHFLGVISPGPDFALITRNALVYSRKAGIYSAAGLGLGILVHVTYSLVGIGFLISQSPLLFSVIKWVGAGYLLYIGYKSLRAPLHSTPLQKAAAETVDQKTISVGEALRMGFITNVTNPKVTLFFFSVFTQVINPDTPLAVQILYGLEMSLATFAWFAFVAIMFSQPWLNKKLTHASGYIEKVMGVILVALALKILFS